MDSLKYILNKFRIQQYGKQMPIVIPNYGRNQLAGLFCELGFIRGVEIGVKTGQYSEILCKANPDLRLHSIDPWRCYADCQIPQERLDGFKAAAQKRLAKYQYCEIIEKFSMDAVKYFSDASLDFVYIDGNHLFEYAVNDIAEWSKKVQSGGIVAGHDWAHYCRDTTHVIEAVLGYTAAYRIRPWFILGNQAKEPGVIRDDIRSFMWVKP